MTGGLMMRFLFCFMIATCCHHFGSALAGDQSSFYRTLLSLERSVLEAIRKHDVFELLAIHNDSFGPQRWKPQPVCANAYDFLSIAVLGYASAIEPTRSQPVRSATENAAWGDKMWAEYLDNMADCERAIGIANPINRITRPSELLPRVLSPLPNRTAPN